MMAQPAFKKEGYGLLKKALRCFKKRIKFTEFSFKERKLQKDIDRVGKPQLVAKFWVRERILNYRW